MKLGIMQPYFLPYIGYFQLIASVDKLIIYDNLKYTKKSWINRNRMLQNGQSVIFSLPLKSASDYLDIREREFAKDFNRKKLLNKFQGAYRRAPYFEQSFPLVEEIVLCERENLFEYLQNSIAVLCRYFLIEISIVKSSEIAIDHNLKSQDKVVAICENVKAHTYINNIGGVDLYSKKVFSENGIELKFIESNPFTYSQFGDSFVPRLSILDAMMFNKPEVIGAAIQGGYRLR